MALAQDWGIRFALLAGIAGMAAAQSNPPTGASTAPTYAASSIVDAASNLPGPLAPNGIASLYGTNLSYTTHALDPGDISNGVLPLTLEGVTVYVNSLRASLIYVSPTQINFLIPYIITASSATLYVMREGVTGPAVEIALASAAPAFFQWNGNLAIAQHADGSLITPGSPAQANEVVVLYLTGLGRTSPDLTEDTIPDQPAQLLYLSELQVLLNGAPIPAASIFYAGVTPGYGGLYQINLQLPPVLAQNPQIQVAMGSLMSPAAIQLPSQ